MTLETAMGIWCTCASLSFIWPQVWRTVRHDTTHGISAFATAHGMVGSALWFAYGLGAGNTAIWFSNASFLVAQSIMMSVLYRHGRMPVQVMLRFAAVFVVALCVLLPLPSSAFGWTATVASATSLVPQVVHVARSENLHAISLASWIVTIISAASWMTFGWIVDDPIMSIVNYITIPMMFYILASATRWRLANDIPLTAGMSRSLQ